MASTGTRRRLSEAERRDQIIAGAVAVLAERGYQAATVEAIVDAAGVSKGLLWHYFTARDALMEQTARHTLVALRDAVAAGVDLSAPAPEVVRAALHGAVGLLESHPTQRRALQEIQTNLRDDSGRLRLSIADFEDTFAAQERLIFRRGQDDGDFRTDLDPRVMALAYQGTVEALLGHLDTHPEVDAAAYADQAADLLLAGLTARTGPLRTR